MSEAYDIDDVLWGLYKNDCQQNKLQPSFKDFTVWCQEEGYDADEPDWTGFDSIERDSRTTDETAEEIYYGNL